MPANIEKARELFLHAVGKVPSEQWQDFLGKACGGDIELEQQVAGLLRLHKEAGSFLDAPASGLDFTAIEPVLEPLGRHIGPYKLLEQIGEGDLASSIWPSSTSRSAAGWRLR